MDVPALRPSLKPYPVQPVHYLLTQTASRCPAKVAIIDGKRSMTFSELDEASSRFAKALQSLGVNKGDRVAIHAFNCLEYEISFYGVSKAGAVVTTLNPSYKEREVAQQLNDSGATVLVTQAVIYPTVSSAMDANCPVRQVIVIGDSPASNIPTFHELLNRSDIGFREVAIDPRRDLMALPYSSGTTGLPKGVMLTHHNLTTNIYQFLGTRTEATPRSDDVFLAFLPLFHIYGMNLLMNVPIALGATQVLVPRFDIEECLHIIERYHVSLLYLVPPIVLGLAQNPAMEKADLSSVRLAVSGAAPLSAEIQDLFERKTLIPSMQGYGLTEASPSANYDFIETHLKRLGSVGPPIPDTEEAVVDVETGLQRMPAGEVGELIIRGPQVMAGYWNAPEATSVALRDGWLYTGDIAKMDADGWVYILDRKKELIKFKGFQIAPAELEAILLEHPEVADVAVIGKPDVEAGEVPKAFVVLKGQVTAEQLMAYVSSQLAGYKRLAEVDFVDQIPRSPSGKILRRVLAEREGSKT